MTKLRKDLTSMRVRPNLADYESARRGFSWESARSELSGLPGGRGINIAHEAVDRHAAGHLANRIAFRFLRLGGAVEERTYADLRRQTNRFAHVLRRLGIEEDERVFALSGRVPELYVTALGALKNKNVFCPHDFLNLLVAVRDELGVTVSESDYGKVGTLQGLVRFLAPRLADRQDR